VPTTGWHSVQPLWNFTITGSIALHLGTCATVVLVNGTGSQFCSAYVYWQMYTFSYLLDRTNGSTFYTISELSASDLTAYYNSTTCSAGACNTTLITYSPTVFGGARSGTYSFLPMMMFNGSMVQGHHYLLVVAFDAWTVVTLTGAPTAFAGTNGAASLNMSGLAGQASLSAIRIL
jgi:hypothetical protein